MGSDSSELFRSRHIPSDDWRDVSQRALTHLLFQRWNPWLSLSQWIWCWLLWHVCSWGYSESVSAQHTSSPSHRGKVPSAQKRAKCHWTVKRSEETGPFLLKQHLLPKQGSGSSLSQYRGHNLIAGKLGFLTFHQPQGNVCSAPSTAQPVLSEYWTQYSLPGVLIPRVYSLSGVLTARVYSLVGFTHSWGLLTPRFYSQAVLTSGFYSFPELPHWWVLLTPRVDSFPGLTHSQRFLTLLPQCQYQMRSVVFVLSKGDFCSFRGWFLSFPRVVFVLSKGALCSLLPHLCALAVSVSSPLLRH